MGLFERLSSLVYGWVSGGVDSKAYIQMMDQEAEAAAKMKRRANHRTRQRINTQMSGG